MGCRLSQLRVCIFEYLILSVLFCHVQAFGDIAVVFWLCFLYWYFDVSSVGTLISSSVYRTPPPLAVEDKSVHWYVELIVISQFIKHLSPRPSIPNLYLPCFICHDMLLFLSLFHSLLIPATSLLLFLLPQRSTTKSSYDAIEQLCLVRKRKFRMQMFHEASCSVFKIRNESQESLRAYKPRTTLRYFSQACCIPPEYVCVHRKGLWWVVSRVVCHGRRADVRSMSVGRV